MLFTSFVRTSGVSKFFARRVEDRQYLAYEFNYAANGMTALIIPIPVSTKDRDRSVKTLNLAPYNSFFDHLSRAFPRDVVESRAEKVLQYVDHVGPITYWPSLTEFEDKVDARYKLPQQFWNKLSFYQDWGLISVILPDTSNKISRVFPIAFEFKTRIPEGLFFPTLELNDCNIKPSASFNHEIYYQGKRRQLSDCPSTSALEESIDYTRSRQLLVEGRGFKRCLIGRYPNGDVIV